MTLDQVDEERKAGIYGGGMGLGFVGVGGGLVAATAGVVNQVGALLGLGVALVLAGFGLLLVFTRLISHFDLTQTPVRADRQDQMGKARR